MRMAAIYARVSSEQQREANTIASQTASLIEFALEHDLEVPKEWVFEDDGYSGAMLERPGLERVRDLAAEGQIQVVLAYAPDRLSRKYAYQILLIEELARNGVETLFVKAAQGASAEDQLLVQFQGMIAEYERAQDSGAIAPRQATPCALWRDQRAQRRSVWLPLYPQNR
jgi:site-specific DNA recombinase